MQTYKDLSHMTNMKTSANFFFFSLCVLFLFTFLKQLQEKKKTEIHYRQFFVIGCKIVK